MKNQLLHILTSLSSLFPDKFLSSSLTAKRRMMKWGMDYHADGIASFLPELFYAFCTCKIHNNILPLHRLNNMKTFKTERL